MKKLSLFAIAFASFAFCACAQVPKATLSQLSPGEIVDKAPPDEWSAIAPEDLLIMDLEPGANGKPRRAVIQLMPKPFSQGWIANIRKLAAAHWWDGMAILRVQDNYVTQWGDPAGEDVSKAKKLPDGLVSVPQSAYITKIIARKLTLSMRDPYGAKAGFFNGWPIATDLSQYWPTHCYAMVGVGRNLSPDTGTGAELYTVIGHAPRHLDRNIALVGRIIEGMEFMSSLPRGTGSLGFYETAQERTGILSVRLGTEIDEPLPAYEYLSTDTKSFAAYAKARANRRDPFFITPAGGADICNIPVPVRRKK